MAFITINGRAQLGNDAQVVAQKLPTQHHRQISQTLRGYQIIDLDPAKLYHKLNNQRSGQFSMEWQLGTETFRTQIFERSIISEDYRLQVQNETGVHIVEDFEFKTYHGWNEANPEYQVRLTVSENYLGGFLEDGDGTTWYIQPESDLVQGGSNKKMVLYRPQDLQPREMGTCGTDALGHRVQNYQDDQSTINTPNKRSSMACKEVDVAVVADKELYTNFGSDASALATHLAAIYNAIEPNYAVFDLEFVISITHIVTTTDPWSATTDLYALLDEFSCWAASSSYTFWSKSPPFPCTNGQNAMGQGFDIACLWTDRDFDGTSIGLAWIGTVCHPGVRTAICEHKSSDLNWLRALCAHETGHNFGSGHYTPSSSAEHYIMEPSLDLEAVSFHSTSQTSINSALSGFSCLDACSAGDCPSSLMISSSNATGNRAAANSIQTTGTINLGSAAMYNAPSVTLEPGFSVPDNITFEIQTTGCN